MISGPLSVPKIAVTEYVFPKAEMYPVRTHLQYCLWPRHVQSSRFPPLHFFLLSPFNLDFINLSSTPTIYTSQILSILINIFIFTVRPIANGTEPLSTDSPSTPLIDKLNGTTSLEHMLKP